MAQTIQLKVTGMTCDHCVRSVTGALSGVPGVKAVEVSLEKNAAKVDGESIDTKALIAAVEEEGYEAAVA